MQEFYRLELVVIVNDRSNTANATTHDIIAATDQATTSNPSTASLAGSLQANPANPNWNKEYLKDPAVLSSPTAFFNHHANRFKSKLIAQTLLPSLNTQHNKDSVFSNSLQQSSKTWSAWNSQRNNLIILANAAAIELYFLCVENEQDAEKLCTKCSEKFFLNLSLTDTIAQAPLIASCIQILARLALKYPNLSKISVRHLSDFLTEPSPILLKQYRHIVEKLNNLKQTAAIKHNDGSKTPNMLKPNSVSRSQTLVYKNGNVSFSKSSRIFEFLRDLTIECLCL